MFTIPSHGWFMIVLPTSKALGWFAVVFFTRLGFKHRLHRFRQALGLLQPLKTEGPQRPGVDDLPFLRLFYYESSTCWIPIISSLFSDQTWSNMACWQASNSSMILPAMSCIRFIGYFSSIFPANQYQPIKGSREYLRSKFGFREILTMVEL